MTQNPNAAIEPPLRLQNPAEATWHDSADIVIVGFGGAGVCAAIEARELGASVIAIDRFGGGGATSRSGGVVYAGGTRVQSEAGFNDTADAMFAYLSMEVGDAITPETLRTFCDGSAADIEWLIAHGVVYNRNALTEKTAYPPDDKSLYYSGNEKVPRYKAVAAPSPRGHRAVGKGFTGYAFFEPLREAAIKAGVNLLTHAPVRRLVVDASDHIIGVEIDQLPASAHADHDKLYNNVVSLPFTGKKAEAEITKCRELENTSGTSRHLIRARNGVILAAGGYIYNLKMLEQYQPFLAKHFEALIRLGSIGDDGSGIQLGQSAGGAVKMLKNTFVNKIIAPPDAQLKGIAVNVNAERFVNEDTYCGFLGAAIAEQPEGSAWLILDRQGFWRLVRQCVFGDRSLFKMFLLTTLMNIALGGTKSSRSLESLGKKCKLDGAVLQKTVAAYNQAAASRKDPLGKSEDHLRPIQAKPFYAINLSLNNKYGFAQVFTLGGLRVNEATGNVVAQDGKNLPGLYAVGRNAVGLCSHGYLSGMSLADCVFSGRRAAKAAITGLKLDEKRVVSSAV